MNIPRTITRAVASAACVGALAGAGAPAASANDGYCVSVAVESHVFQRATPSPAVADAHVGNGFHIYTTHGGDPSIPEGIAYGYLSAVGRPGQSAVHGYIQLSNLGTQHRGDC
jgi:hypothetical protein